MGTVVPYYDLLLRLALFQKEQHLPVRYSYQTVNGLNNADKGPSRSTGSTITQGVVVQPVLEPYNANETLPLYNFPDLDPIRLWVSFGYATLVKGSLEEGRGQFSLTEKALGMDLVQSSQ